MAAAKKETLYIDADDEITAVIEKVVTAKPKIVAVVLPKHASVFQSSVNMKLLQKAAKNAKKNIALITSDKSIKAIAASTGMLVAKTPTSKPSVPELQTAKPETEKAEADADVDTKSEPEDKKTKKDAEAAKTEADSDEEAIELDNTKETAVEPDAVDDKKKKKMVKIPDFSSFRMKVGLGIAALIGLIVLWVYGFVILPKAQVTINTDISRSSINATLSAKLDEGTELDLESNTLPATRVQVEKIDTLTVPATGEKNIGDKATGTMNVENCINDGEEKILPAGTAFSSGSRTFVTTEAVTLDFAIFAGNTCLSSDFGRDKTVGVIATQPGPDYNLDARSYTSSISGINAFGSDMSGGTTETVTVVSEEDIDNATQELTGISRSAALEELKTQLSNEGLRPIEESFAEGNPKVVSAPSADTEASEVKVTRTITYNLIGVSDSDLASIVENEVAKNLDGAQQNVRDNGVGDIVFQVLDRPDESEQTLGIQTVATIGPDIDVELLKNDIVGKKRGDIEKLIEAIDGVKSVSVEYSPAWITTTPKSTDKIEIVFNEINDNQ